MRCKVVNSYPVCLTRNSKFSRNNWDAYGKRAGVDLKTVDYAETSLSGDGSFSLPLVWRADGSDGVLYRLACSVRQSVIQGVYVVDFYLNFLTGTARTYKMYSGVNKNAATNDPKWNPRFLRNDMLIANT